MIDTTHLVMEGKYQELSKSIKIGVDDAELFDSSRFVI